MSRFRSVILLPGNTVLRKFLFIYFFIIFTMIITMTFLAKADPLPTSSKADRLTDYSPPMMALNFETGHYVSERNDPKSGDVTDYVSCTRPGKTWAIQPDGEIVQYAANTPTMGKLGNTYGLLRTNGERNWALNSFTPALWSDSGGIMTKPADQLPGHDARVLSSNTWHMITTGVDSGANWSSGDVIPVRAFFIHGNGERFRIRLRDTSDNDDIQITITGETIDIEQEDVGAVSGATLYEHGIVRELVFYVTLADNLAAANTQLAVSAGIDDASYSTIIVGVEIGDSGDNFTSIIKTATAEVQARRDVVFLKSDLMRAFEAGAYTSFQMEQEIFKQYVGLEITDGIDTTEWRFNVDGTSQRIASSGGGTELAVNTPTANQARELVRGYWGPRYGVSLAGEPIYSAEATGRFVFAPTTIFIGGSKSGTSGVIKSFVLAHGQVDPQPLRILDGSEFHDRNVTVENKQRIIRAQMSRGDEARKTQFHGSHPLEHIRLAAKNGDYAVSGDIGRKFRNELHLPQAMTPSSSYPMTSYEFIVAVEPHTAIEATYPFYVLFQLKDSPDAGEGSSSPPLAIELVNSTNFRLQTRTSTVEDVGTVTTPSPTIEHDWAYTPWEAHHIILDWIDGRGNNDGLVRLWLNGELVVNETKPTGYNQDNECYPKWGVYAGPESGTSGEYSTHFMNFRVRRDGKSWSSSPNYTLPKTTSAFPITLAKQAW